MTILMRNVIVLSDYLGDDDVLPKDFLEGLMEMADRIERGEEKLIPMDKDFFDRLKNLTDDVELDDEELNDEDFE